MKKKKELWGTRAGRETPFRCDIYTWPGGERTVEGKGFPLVFFFLFYLFFFCTSANLGKGIRYESNGVARNGLTRCIVVSRFASRISGCLPGGEQV